MSTFMKVLFVILVILIIILAVLYYFGRKLERRQMEQQSMLKAAEQVVSMLIIDKKMMKLREAGFPQFVVDNTPKYLRRSKVPVVKAKIGPRIMTLMCDGSVFEQIPVKKEVKATVSGIYITAVKGIRGSLETKKKKKGFFAKFRNKDN